MQIMLIGKSKIVLPIVLKVEDITQEQENEEYKTVNGRCLNLKGGETLRKFSISSFFPSKKYNFSNGPAFPLQYYLNFFKNNKDNPVRIIIISKNTVFLNMLCRYNFDYNISDRAGDVPFKLDVIEYINPHKLRSVIYDYF